MLTGSYSMIEPITPLLPVKAASFSWSMDSIMLALKLWRSPSVWPTSCITTAFSDCSMYSCGSGLPGARSMKAVRAKFSSGARATERLQAPFMKRGRCGSRARKNGSVSRASPRGSM